MIALAELLLAGCSLLGVGGSGPLPEEYFDGADLELAGAIRARQADRIAALLDAGANAEATGTYDLTMLQYAVETNSLPGIEALLGAGADPDRIGASTSALYRAVGRSLLVRALLAGGADPDVPNPGTGETAVAATCLAADLESFEELVAADADLHHENLLGELALHTCARTNQGAIVLRMLELGVDPLAPTMRGDTFQEIYFGYPPAEVLNDRAREERRKIVAWLVARGYALVPEAEPYH